MNEWQATVWERKQLKQAMVMFADYVTLPEGEVQMGDLSRLIRAVLDNYGFFYQRAVLTRAEFEKKWGELDAIMETGKFNAP